MRFTICLMPPARAASLPWPLTPPDVDFSSVTVSVINVSSSLLSDILRATRMLRIPLICSMLEQVGDWANFSTIFARFSGVLGKLCLIFFSLRLSVLVLPVLGSVDISLIVGVVLSDVPLFPFDVTCLTCSLHLCVRKVAFFWCNDSFSFCYRSFSL